jgi:site-specific DNA recombinase
VSGKKFLRCAVYTRKSSEEGLDQDFNSLEAQREACASYIQSQAHEGWRLVPELLDDGGYSGGNTDRPALTRLMELVRAGEIDVIVIYKIDRLTRSLTDFARMAEAFDKHNVSFVSVTQQFNTTTSMGRLMLNVLLSFAQFEREITGERIRDKIAASKRKGMWMGGNPPMGYDVRDRQLIVNEADAATVRRIFELYLESGTVPALLARLELESIRTAKRYSAKGKHYGNRPFTRGHLHKMLTNPIYIGRVSHKGSTHAGQHLAIIATDLWDQVQAQLAANVQGARTRGRRADRRAGTLAGLLVSSDGTPFVESHATKGTRRYRYYVEQPDTDRPAIRLPSNEIEATVSSAVVTFLHDHRLVLANIGEVAQPMAPSALRNAEGLAHQIANDPSASRALLQKVTFQTNMLLVDVGAPQLREALGLGTDDRSGNGNGDQPIALHAPLLARRRGRQMKLLLANNLQTSEIDASLVTVVARAHRWAELITSGAATSLSDIARSEGVALTYVAQLMPLAFLSPSIVTAILEGRHPTTLTAQHLVRRVKIPAAWHNQDETFRRFGGQHD